MYWSMSLNNHLKITPSNLTGTNHLDKNEELLLLVWTGSYHHLTIRSKDKLKNEKLLFLYLFSNILAQMFLGSIFFRRWDALNVLLHNLENE